MSAPAPETREAPPPAYVYELPVRIWHWVTGPCILVLAITGFLIGHPAWPLVMGEPSHLYLMGDIRFIHFATAYVLTVTFVGRLYWALVGNRYAREIFLPAVWRGAWWCDFYKTLRWYLFLERAPQHEVGHNPIAQMAFFLVFVLGVVFQIVTGFALYGEGAGPGSISNTLFSSWVIPLFGGSQELHTWHHLAMWYILLFVMVHIYLVIREEIMSRQTMLSAMVSGWRYFKGERS